MKCWIVRDGEVVEEDCVMVNADGVVFEDFPDTPFTRAFRARVAESERDLLSRYYRGEFDE